MKLLDWRFGPTRALRAPAEHRLPIRLNCLVNHLEVREFGKAALVADPEAVGQPAGSRRYSTSEGVVAPRAKTRWDPPPPRAAPRALAIIRPAAHAIATPTLCGANVRRAKARRAR